MRYIFPAAFVYLFHGLVLFYFIIIKRIMVVLTPEMEDYPSQTADPSSMTSFLGKTEKAESAPGSASLKWRTVTK